MQEAKLEKPTSIKVLQWVWVMLVLYNLSNAFFEVYSTRVMASTLLFDAGVIFLLLVVVYALFTIQKRILQVSFLLLLLAIYDSLLLVRDRFIDATQCWPDIPSWDCCQMSGKRKRNMVLLR